MDRMAEAWLRCSKIVPGMFRNEVVVEVRRADGEQTAYFVPREKVSERDRKVLVLVDETDEAGRPWVILPTDHPYSPIQVSREDLVPA